jgi:hypothetical protein
MTALSRAHALLQRASERGDGHAISFQSDELKALLDDATISATKAAHAATAPGWRDLNVALQMIRDAVEELGPVASCSVSRDQFEPRPIDDAEAIIAGILKIKDRAENDARVPALAAIREARRRLAKGRALWNGPCHECDAVLAAALLAEG